MKRVAIPIVLVAVLAAAWWIFGRLSPDAVDPLAPFAPVAVDAPVQRVDIAGEAEGVTRTHAVEVIPTVEPVVPVAAEDAMPLGAGEAELVVRVISAEEKNPIAAIRLYLHPLPSPQRFGAKHVEGSLAKLGEAPVTDKTGTARYVLSSGASYRVSTIDAERIGSASAEILDLEAGERRHVELVGPTREDARFFGRLVAEEDESPVVGARVELVAPGGEWTSQDGALRPSGVLLTEHGKIENTVLTDSDGRFEFTYSSWKPRYACILALGRSPLISDLPRVHDSKERALLIRLRRAASLACRVVDSSGRGVSDTQVRASLHSYLLGREGGDFFGESDPAWEASTSGDGRCALGTLPSRVPLTLEIVRDRKVVRRDAESLILEPGEDRSIELVLGSGARIRGRIVDQDEKPVTGREVWLKRAESPAVGNFQEYETVNAKAYTDGEGVFLFEDVPVGDWWVGPGPRPQYGRQGTPIEQDCASVAELAQVVQGAAEVEVLVRTHRGLLIRGRVVGSDGKTGSNGYVMAWRTGGGSHADAHTDDEGAFTLGPLSAGEYLASAQGFGGTDSASEPTTTRAGDLELILRLRPGGGVEGKVVDASSGVSLDAMITLSLTGPQAVHHGGITSTQTRDGTFALGNQPPGPYAISARTSDGKYGAAAVTIVEGETAKPVEVRVEPGALLRVRCAGEKGQGSFQILHGGTRIAFDGAQAGSTSEHAVPAGQLVLRNFVGSIYTPVDQTLTLAKGETREVVIQPYK